MKRLIKRLGIAHKFALVGLLALGMVTVPATMVVKSRLDELSVARSEVAGVGPSLDVIGLIRLTQEHRGLSADYLGGSDGVREARERKQTDVDAALARALSSTGSLGSPKLTALGGRISSDWQALARAAGGKTLSGPESYTRHTALVADELKLLEAVTDVSGLTLDPEAGSYYLMTAALSSMPLLAESLGQARGRGTLFLARGEARPEEKVLLGALAETARTQFDTGRAAFEKAIEAAPVVKDAIEKPLAAALAACDEAFKLADEKIVHADKLSYPSGDYRAALTRGVDAQFALIESAAKALDGMLTERVAGIQRGLTALVGALGILGALALWIGVAIARSVTGSIRQAVAIAQTVAAGDLTSSIEVTALDETGALLSALKAMNESLVGVVGSVRHSAESIGNATGQIAAGNHDLSSRTEEQASSLEETASSMEQLTSTVKQNADNARQVNALADTASEKAAEGGRTVAGVVSTMQDIAASSARIQDIIQVIDGIAFQTNILALNAAVEAARAGEQGRGFAVVASEVRSLAQRSASAAKEIKELITASAAKVDGGTGLVDAAGRQMTEIVEAVKRVTDVISEITAASGEQASGIEQVNQAVTQMDQVTQQNAALVEQAAAAAESLKEEAGHLVQAVSAFKLPGGAPPAAEASAFARDRAPKAKSIVEPGSPDAAQKVLPNASRSRGRTRSSRQAEPGVPRRAAATQAPPETVPVAREPEPAKKVANSKEEWTTF